VRYLVVGWSARGAGLAIGVGVVWAVGLLLSSAIDVLALLFIAVLLAAALEPFVGWIRGRVRLGRGLTILLVYAVFFAVVAGFAFLVLPAALTQAEDVAARLPAFLDEVAAAAASLQPEAAQRAVLALVGAARDALAPAPPPDSEEVVQVGITLAEALVSIGTVLALVFFWLVGHARLQRYALAFVPRGRRSGVRDAWNEVEGRLGMWVRGQLILMAIVGTASGLAYVVLGVPSALLLGLVAGIAEAIPLVGPILGAIPAVLAAATVSPELVLLVVGATALIQVVENNVLVPVVMRNSIGLSPIVVLLALLFGGALGGIMGALVAVPLVAAVDVILGRLQDRDTPVAQDPAAVDVPDDAETRRLGRFLPEVREASSAREASRDR
jgi:predicted PurR-regulated permease PerM